MNKIVLIFLSVILPLFMCGCASGVYSQADRQYLVASIAFEGTEDTITAYCEAIVVNEESIIQGTKRRVIAASGSTVQDAIENIGNKISEPLLFDHLVIVLLSENLSGEQIEQVLSYCRKNEEINLASYLATTKSPSRLLKCKNISTLAVGFDLLGVIENTERTRGIDFNSRYYEVCADRLRSSPSFFLPFFEARKGEYMLSGAVGYDEDFKIEYYSLEKAKRKIAKRQEAQSRE